MVKVSEKEQLQALLSKVYEKGNDGASLQEVMNDLKNEIPNIFMIKEHSAS